MRNEKIFCIIPSRYASTRFPGKPLALINGRTLLERTYLRVKLCPLLNDILIATDDTRILSHTKTFDAKSIMTSSECKNGTERITEAITKIDEIEDNDIIVNVQGDHPLICPKTIEAIINILQKDSNAVMSTAATLMKDKDEILSPNTVKVVFDKNYKALYFSRSPIPFAKNLDKTKYYYHIGIYAYRAYFLKKLAKLQSTENQISEDLEQLKVLENGYSIKVALVRDKPFGVDTPQDITKIERELCQ